MLRLLTIDEQRTLHHRYRNSDLFRQWSGILCQLEREIGEMDAVSLWFQAERYLSRLREIMQYRDEEIPYIFNDLLQDCSTLDNNGKSINRSQEAAERSAITIMCVMLTSLMNAVEKGHEDEYFGNKAMCVAIVNLLRDNAYYSMLMNAFFGRDIGNDGQKVVIAPADPMNAEVALEAMDKTAKQELEEMREKVIGLTQRLQVLFREDWDVWKSLWNDICMDAELMQLLTATNPPKNEWGLNEKMVCNVIGIFIKVRGYKNCVSKANSLLAEPAKNRRDYITNYGRNGGSSAVFSDEQLTKIENIIQSKIIG